MPLDAEPQPNPDDKPTVNAGEVQLRWTTLQDAATDLVAATGTDDPNDWTAALNAFRQAGQLMDLQTMLNTPLLPADAGEHKAVLQEMLTRIPDGWGRWLGCGPGWYPLLVDLHHALVQLFPDYQPEQIKEKYGTLRFYWDTNAMVTDPAEPTAPDIPAKKDRTQEIMDAWQVAHEAWYDRLEVYRGSPEGVRRQQEQDERRQQADELVAAAEKLTEFTCEQCGQPGELHCTTGPHPWYKTLCRSCATSGAHGEYITHTAWTAQYRGPRPNAD